MKLKDDLLRQLRATFQFEADEHLQAMSRHLLALEQQPDANEAGRLLAEIFREAHSLKGAARAVNPEPVEALAHQLETLFSRVQHGAVQPHPELFDQVYQALDAIGSLVRASTADETAAVDVGAICARLEAIGERPDPAHGTPASDVSLAVPEPAGELLQAPPIGGPELPPSEPAASPGHLAPESKPRQDVTVRVTTAKLDVLMAQIGELQVTRIGAAQRVAEVRALLEYMEGWEAEWRKLRAHYRRLRLIRDERARANRDQAARPRRAEAATTADGWREIGALLAFLESNETYLHATCAQLRELSRTFAADSRRMAQVTADLQDDVRRMRMLPIATVFDTFPRMVRDLARERGKEVRLIINGGETEVDRSVIEQIKAPLMHLLRNGVDHGIEPPAARLAAGKPREGTITLTAAQRGDTILVLVADDGAGIDLKRVRASSIKQGFLTAEAAEAMSDHEVLWLIFRSGVSTSPTITDISGRGVGMDVVREHIERLNGLIDVASQLGHGTDFSLTLPLTVATTLCLLVRAGGQTLALPIANVARILRLEPDMIGRAEGREAIRVDGRPVPLTRLADVLDLAAPTPAGHQTANAKPPAIILGMAEKRVAYLVDALIGTQELVIKSLPRPLNRVRHTAGATILGTGEVVMILNVADLLRSAGRASIHPPAPLSEAASPRARLGVILVADDSITTRALEKNILEAAGYQVRVAADGMEAWSVLQSDGCDVLVSDVNMPRMDGFELATKLRADAQFKDLPIILVTSLDSPGDRERGVAAGADAYVVKSAFDQDILLATIRRLI